jgi:cell division protein FtsQ
MTLTQRIAVAVLNQKSLIGDNGDVFSPPVESFPPDLPEFFCTKEQVKDVLQQYDLFTSVANSANLNVLSIKLTTEGSWSVNLSNNIVVMLGDKDILERFSRFIKVYTKVFVPEHRQPSYVDMRYGHGMAVQWKS